MSDADETSESEYNSEDQYDAPRGQPDNSWGDEISRELTTFLASKSFTFSCGGTIRVTSNDTDSANAASTTDKDAIATTTPFSLRWDSSRDHGRKITFPVTGKDGEAELAALQQDCQPASFGYQGKDVHDETYRKASKMDRSAFSSDFCPYELGIVNTIAQVLLPERSEGVRTSGVRAELYKLNIYSAPSGFFKSHVDTPRSETQFGSLVVSLPCHHEGGELIVRHAGHAVTFDWSTSAVADAGLPSDSIHWAAFYSDCEHEVKELTAGHRVTLTYNLYHDLGVGDLATHAPALQPSSLPLYDKVRAALASPVFLPDGGILGMFCTHGYAHNTHSGAGALPGVLKGADMAVFAVFRALGLRVHLRAVFPRNQGKENGGWYYDEEDEEEDGEEGTPFNTRVGRRIGELVITEAGGNDGDGWNEIWESWHHDKMNVCWLTNAAPGKKLMETSMIHMTYGNEAGINAIYTRLAILISVGPADDRLKAPELPKQEPSTRRRRRY